MKEKIMIVDDHEEIREVVHVLLTNEGYQIIEAKDGKDRSYYFRCHDA